jgi:hypothetical protein
MRCVEEQILAVMRNTLARSLLRVLPVGDLWGDEFDVTEFEHVCRYWPIRKNLTVET